MKYVCFAEDLGEYSMLHSYPVCCLPNELPEFNREKNPWMVNQDCTPEHLEGSRKYDLICLSAYRASA